MKKNKGESDLRLIYVALVAIVVTMTMAFTSYAICTHCREKNNSIPTRNSIWEENTENTDVFNMSKIIKKYRVRSI